MKTNSKTMNQKMLPVLFNIFLLICMALLINSCTKARHTGLKGFKYVKYEPERKTTPPTIKNTFPAFDDGNIQPEPTAQVVDDENLLLAVAVVPPPPLIRKTIHEEKAIATPAKKSVQHKKKMMKGTKGGGEIFKDKSTFKDHGSTNLVTTFAINFMMVWIAGFLVVGIGSIMHVFLVGALVMTIISLI